jgi:site-specific DNA-cytosine methylase
LPKCAVLFDGAGLARLGLELAGWSCVGVDLNPISHHLGKFVGSGNVIQANAEHCDLTGCDACWASPPCQWGSQARTQGNPESEFSHWMTDWALKISTPVLWVENVMARESRFNEWGRVWNAAQFTDEPMQNRNRIVGGHHPEPKVFHPYQKTFANTVPTILATEYKGSAGDQRRASRYFGRKLTLEECAYYQGFEIPKEWWEPLPGFTPSKWRQELYKAIGNGVPCYMSYAFGQAALKETKL